MKRAASAPITPWRGGEPACSFPREDRSHLCLLARAYWRPSLREGGETIRRVGTTGRSIHSRAAASDIRTPSLRQHELDQVQRVTALPKPAVSQPLVGTPQVKLDDAGSLPALSISTGSIAGRRTAPIGARRKGCHFPVLMYDGEAMRPIAARQRPLEGAAMGKERLHS